MFDTEEKRKAFLDKYQIGEDTFRDSMLTWEELDRIGKDYMGIKGEHEDTVRAYAEVIRMCPSVHSLHWRAKDPEHLIEKIIRKNAELTTKGDTDIILFHNYRARITDLMGVRVLLLFKEDWEAVHDFLINEYGDSLYEKPFAYIRRGDSRDIYKDKIEIKDEKSYRSIHYVCNTEIGSCVEIQVRTLYEEAWGEVDHKIRYPYNVSNDMMTNYLNILNRLTGMADEMCSFMNSYITYFEEANRKGIVTDNEVYNYIINRLEESLDEDAKKDIIDKIKAANDYRRMVSLSDVISDFMNTI